MKTFYEVLEHLYKKVLLGATLEDNHDYISHLSPTFLDKDHQHMSYLELSLQEPGSVDWAAFPIAPICLKRLSQISNAREIMLLQLTVIRVMITRILSINTERQAKEEYISIIKILLKSSEVDSKLIYMFQKSDKLFSHMAAKCLALLLYFQLREKITLSNSGITFCQKNLSEYSESDMVVYCLETLTVVMKEIFKDNCSHKTELLQQFLTPFDTTFELFYSSLFSQCFEHFQETSKILSSLMGFLELLELLIASRIYLKLYFICQRVFFLKPSCVLNVLSWSAPAFVKRKFIIFLKKCLLCKVSEDLFCGYVPVLMPPDPLLNVDLLTVANAILQAVSLGWLRTLSVPGKPACFGSSDTQPGYECDSGLDHVTLRAVSLVLIKSLEIKFQNSVSPNEIKDQDDDMLEAAKALLDVYLKLARGCYHATENSTQEKERWNHHTHENGYNPHCIFLFFITNIEFDSTVLLDFLISSETCFLEYFVKYLKLLQTDWYNFFTISKYFDEAESNDGLSVYSYVPLPVQDRSTHQTEHYGTALVSWTETSAWASWASDPSSELKRQCDNQAMIPKKTHFRFQGASGSLPQTSHHLVDYDSSDDSEVESIVQCSANSSQTSLHQEATKKIKDTFERSQGNKELTPVPQSRSLVPKEMNYYFSSDCEGAQNTIVSKVGVAYKTVKCFEKLQGAIDRLQKKNLFPYNPTALLKLLKHIKAIIRI
ncbi:protein Lines homolog 1 [Rhynchocyon petersi]